MPNNSNSNSNSRHNNNNQNITATATATLLIKCQDQAGIVQAVSEFIFRYGGNIISLDQYSTAHEGGQYFMRSNLPLQTYLKARRTLMS